MVRKRFAFVAALVALLALLWATGGVVAGPPAEGPGGEVTIAGTVASKISYQGRLTDSAGNPLDGTYTMQFQLYDAQSGGTMLWDSGAQSVQVTDGLFNVELGVDQSDFNGQELWLAVFVDGEALLPRQQILPVPYALSLRPGAQIRDEDVGHATLSVQNGWPGGFWLVTKKAVEAWTSDGTALWGAAGSGIGVDGVATSPDGYGGYFYNTASGGVALYARAQGNSDADLVLGGTSSTNDDGRIASDPAYSSSDIVLVSNDDIRIDLDNDGDGEDADFEIRDKDNNLIFNVDESGDVDIAGNLTAGDANVSLPIAYAFINADGSVAKGTSNVSSVWNGTASRYEITIAGENYFWKDYVTIVTPAGTNPRMVRTSSVGGKLLVVIYDTAGTQVQCPFQFITYKP